MSSSLSIDDNDDRAELPSVLDEDALAELGWTPNDVARLAPLAIAYRGHDNRRCWRTGDLGPLFGEKGGAE